MKYFLRGLATGLILSAVLMAIAARQNELSDEEIMVRAQKLGMVTKDTTLGSANKDSKDPSEDTKPQEEPAKGDDHFSEKPDPEGDQTAEDPMKEGTKDPGESLKPETGSDPEQQGDSNTEQGTGEDQQLQEQNPQGEQKPVEEQTTGGGSLGEDKDPEQTKNDEGDNASSQEKDTVTIQIYKGNSSYTVAKALQAAGLVEDARAYDNFLCKNKYDKSLSVGIYEIPLGTGEEEIALIITRRKK